METNESGVIPTGDKIVVKPMKVERVSAGGIALPDQVVDKEGLAARIGKVLAIAPHARDHPCLNGITVGDTVLFARYSGDFFPVNGISYIIMRAESVIGKAEKLPDYMLNAAKSSLEAFGANEKAA